MRLLAGNLFSNFKNLFFRVHSLYAIQHYYLQIYIIINYKTNEKSTQQGFIQIVYILNSMRFIVRISFSS